MLILIMLLGVLCAIGLTLYFGPILERHNATLVYRVYTIEGAMYEIGSDANLQISSWVMFTYEGKFVRIPKERILRVEDDRK
jgi:hypothetical protein